MDPLQCDLVLTATAMASVLLAIAVRGKHAVGACILSAAGLIAAGADLYIVAWRLTELQRLAAGGRSEIGPYSVDGLISSHRGQLWLLAALCIAACLVLRLASRRRFEPSADA